MTRSKRRAAGGLSTTAEEAMAMLDKAADKAKAIASFNNGTDGFKDRDLYQRALRKII